MEFRFEIKADSMIKQETSKSQMAISKRMYEEYN
jgi:hypothetical protein